MMLIAKFGGDDLNEKLEQFSRLLGVKLPEPLCAFLKKYNGGETPRTQFRQGGKSLDVRAFYGLGQVKYPYAGVNLVTTEVAQYLPIAIDTFGNEFLVDVGSGWILFQDHETSQLSPLANDLRAFVASCSSEWINPNAVKSIRQREQELIQRGRGHIITDALRQMWQAEIDKYTSMQQEEVIF